MARFQIISKVPFRDPRGATEKAQVSRDKDYLNYLTAQDLIQYYGRSNRAPDDASVTWIIDDNIERFIKKYERFFTRYFLEAFEKINYISDAWIPELLLQGRTV